MKQSPKILCIRLKELTQSGKLPIETIYYILYHQINNFLNIYNEGLNNEDKLIANI